MQKLAVSKRKVLWIKCMIWAGTTITFTAIPFIVTNPYTFSSLVAVLVGSGLALGITGIQLSTNLFHCPHCGHVLHRNDVSPLYDILCFDDLPEHCGHCNWKVDVEISR